MADPLPPVPRHDPRRPPLVGRAREQDALRDHLAAALAGHGGLVLVGGEAGIGKTALAEETCREAAARGALVLVGRCYDLSETPPYGPWAEAFARAPADDTLPSLPAAVLPAEGQSEHLPGQGAVVARVLAYLIALAARRPLVLLLDDLHWADPASLNLLRALARQVAALPLLLLATYRADEVARGHPLYALLPALVREARPDRLDLRPLGEAALRALVGGHNALDASDEARLVTYLQAQADGNPFFVGELLRALTEAEALRPAAGAWVLGDLAVVGVPPLVRQVIDARVDRLGAATRDLLAVGAVLGQVVPFDLWQLVSDAEAAALHTDVEPALTANLLAETPDGRGARFVHALVREALYAGLPTHRRRALHGRAAEALLAQPAPDPDAVAYHLQRAGDPRAADWLLRAGGRALHAYAWLTAADRFEAALPWLEQAGAPAGERAWVLYALARLRVYAQPQRSAAALAAAARLVADDRALLGYVEQLRGLIACMGGDFQRGLAAMAAGVTTLERAAAPAIPDRLRAVWGEPPAVAELRGQLANWLAYAGRFAEVADLLARVAAHPGPAIPYYHAAEGTMHAALGRPPAARLARARYRTASRAREDYFQVAFSAFEDLSSGVMRYQADDLPMRQAMIAECEEAMIRASDVLMAGLAPRLARFPTSFVEGRWTEARTLAQQAHVEDPPLTHHCNPLAGAVAVAQGDLAQAWAIVYEELPEGPVTPPGRIFLLSALSLLHLAATLALDAGDLPAARAWLEAHDRWLAWAGAVLGRAEGALGWAAYHRAAGDPARAREHAAAALAHASDPRQPLALLAAHRLLGELDGDAGRHDDAATHLRAALVLADACAAPYERALTLLALTELRAATGERAAAGAALDEARALCEPLAAGPALARAGALAARLALLRTPRPAAPAGLTAREVEVLRLIATGNSNREIAAALCLSVRTVERHIENIYSKTGSHSKADATAFAFRHHLT
ncbi:MAG TPA: AAA family ATPase [Thermomicrobiales bacterium]|nr:AAA family ATPase [Thermomicrobiales bacterium]